MQLLIPCSAVRRPDLKNANKLRGEQRHARFTIARDLPASFIIPSRHANPTLAASADVLTDFSATLTAIHSGMGAGGRKPT